MPPNVAERSFFSVLSALCGTSWTYYGLAHLHVPIALHWQAVAAIAVGIVAGSAMGFHYRGGHRTELESTEDTPLGWRVGATLAGVVGGGIAGYVGPSDLFGLRTGSALCIATSVTLASILGAFAWSHPSLFFRNRRFSAHD